MASEKPIAVIAALIGNLLIALAKLAAGILGGSSAMLAEAAHSFSDVGNQILLLVGIRRAHRPASARHPFGTAKSQYFWPMLVAVLLFGVAGGYSLFEGIEKLRHPHPLHNITLSLSILGIAFVIESVTIGVALRQAIVQARADGAASVREWLDENRDATLLTVIVEDGLALASLPVAAAAIALTRFTGDPMWDGIGSVLIGAMLMGFALFLGTQIRAMLIGLGLKQDDVDRIHRVVADDALATGILSMQSMHLGPRTALMGAEIVLVPGLDLPTIDTTLRRLEAAMVREVPALKHVYLEPHA